MGKYIEFSAFYADFYIHFKLLEVFLAYMWQQTMIIGWWYSQCIEVCCDLNVFSIMMFLF